MSIKFKNKDHEKFYEQCLGRTGSLDPYHKAFFYTMGISGETRKHIEDIFNFREDAIRPEGLNKGWQTSGSSCLTRLAFNLSSLRSIYNLKTLFTSLVISLTGSRMAGGCSGK